MPASATEGGYTYTGGTYERSADVHSRSRFMPMDYIGKIIPRNACRGPWTNTLDGKIAIALPFGGSEAKMAPRCARA